MKIGILTERLLLGFGVDLVVHEQARRLAERGHDVTVFPLRADPHYRSQAYQVDVLGDRFGVDGDYVSDERAEEIIEAFDLNAFDILILHTPPFFGWIKFLDTPVIAVEHGVPPSHYFPQHIAYELWKATTRHLVENLSRLRDSDAILSISQSIHNWLPERLRSRSRVIYHGADHYAAATPAAAATFRRDLGVEPDDVLILWVGRMQITRDEQPYKGFAELRELMPRIRRISPRTRIAFLGKIDDSERQWLDSLDVILLPNYPAARMGTAYAAADILLNLSRWEGFNLALVEAQYQGTPVIAYDVGPHCEVTRDNHSGLLVTDDAGGPLNALRMLVCNDQLREQMSENARAFAADWTWERNLDQLEELLTDCRERHIAEPPGARIFVERAGYRPSHLSTRAGATTLKSTPQSAKQFSMDELLELDGEDFIKAVFLQLLGRPVDSEGKRHYLNRLKRGAPKLAVIRDVTQTEEFVRSGTTLPDGFLRELPAAPERLTLARARRYIALGKQPLLRLEGKAFIDAAFHFILKRPADQQGLDYHYMEWLQTADRLRILRDLAASKEARSKRRWNSLLRLAIAVRRLRHLFSPPPLPPILTVAEPEFWVGAWSLIYGHGPSHDERVQFGTMLANTGDRVLVLEAIAQSPSARAYRFSKLRAALESPAVKKWQVQQQHRHRDKIVAQLDGRLANLDRQIGDIGHAAKPQAAPRQEQVKEGNRLRQAIGAISKPDGCHVFLAAPGVRAKQSDLAAFANKVTGLEADIIFGDEYIAGDAVGRRRLRHIFRLHSFLSQPDLGGIIAVRKDLLADAGLSAHVALTGETLMALVAVAHSFAHLPGIICERDRNAMIANLPSQGAIQQWMDARRLPAILSVGSAGQIDIAFAAPAGADVMVIVRGMPADPAMAIARPTIDGLTLHWHHFTCDDAAHINAAVEAFHGDYVVFCDAGLCGIDGVAMERLIGLASQSGIGLASALVLTADGRIAEAGWQLIGEKECVPIDRLRTPADRQLELTPQLQEVLGVDLQYTAVRRSAFLAAGGLDADLAPIAQGIDIGIRLAQFQLVNIVDGQTLAHQGAAMTGAITNGLPELAAEALLANHAGLHVAVSGLSNPLEFSQNSHDSSPHHPRVATLPPAVGRANRSAGSGRLFDQIAPRNGNGETIGDQP